MTDVEVEASPYRRTLALGSYPFTAHLVSLFVPSMIRLVHLRFLISGIQVTTRAGAYSQHQCRNIATYDRVQNSINLHVPGPSFSSLGFRSLQVGPGLRTPSDLFARDLRAEACLQGVKFRHPSRLRGPKVLMNQAQAQARPHWQRILEVNGDS